MERPFTEEAVGEGPNLEFTCPDCGGHRFTTALVDDSFEYGSGDSRVTLHAKVPVHSCDSCDFEFLGREGRRISHEAVCRHLGLLTPREIRRIREGHGMSRTAFAKVTGFGEATLNRWENGAVIQNRANDRYLRLSESGDILARLQDMQDRQEPLETVAAQRQNPDGTLAWKRLRVSEIHRREQTIFRLAA